MTALDLSSLSHAEKDALILTLMARLEATMKRIDELQARIDELTGPGKTSGNSSSPPSKDQKPNTEAKPARQGPRSGSLGRKGGGRALNANPDKTVIARPSRCRYCRVGARIY